MYANIFIKSKILGTEFFVCPSELYCAAAHVRRRTGRARAVARTKTKLAATF